MLGFPFDWRNPNYEAVFSERIKRLERLRADPSLLEPLKLYYRDNPADFVSDWGTTLDPRNVERGLPALVPFVLFERQVEWIDFVIKCWRDQRPGITEKSRDSGVSWLSVALACTLCLFHRGLAVGFGSRKEEYVDRIGDPKSLFYKARLFMDELPVEFRMGWESDRHAPHMRIMFPQSDSIITGESGDNIGRGDRKSIYFVDEAAFLEHPLMIDAALSQTTNCRQDVSTPNGLGNPFEQKRHAGKIEVFTFHWRDDPRKDDGWYAKQVADIDNPIIVAQELDIDYAASVEGVLIPHAWVLAAFDACEKLGIEPSGESVGALDVADEGGDLLAFAVRHGVEVKWLEEWPGKGADIFKSVERAFRICDHFGLEGFRYDSDGLGAGVRGDARVVNVQRGSAGQPKISATPYRGSGAVWNPDGQDVRGRKNKDFFANCKAQSWWALRERFRKTHRWIVGDEDGVKVRCSPDEIVSLSATIDQGDNPRMRLKLAAELSQPTFATTAVGKIAIDKAPEGTKSPNLADAVVIDFARGLGEMKISEGLMTRARVATVVTAMQPTEGAQKPVSGSGLYVSNALLYRARDPQGAGKVGYR